MGGETTALITSAGGVQQGCNIGPLGYSTWGGMTILKNVKAAPPVPVKARISAFIDDVTMLVPPELALDMDDIGKVMGWVQARLLKEGIMPKRRKSKVISAGGVNVGDLSTNQRAELDLSELKVAGKKWDGDGMMGVPIRTEEYSKGVRYGGILVVGQEVELLRVLVKAKDVEASFQITRLLASTRLTIPLFHRNKGTARTAEDPDALQE